MEYKHAWHVAAYRATTIYIAVLVTTILSLQIYRFFISAPSDEIKCDTTKSTLSYIPVIGVLFDG